MYKKICEIEIDQLYGIINNRQVTKQKDTHPLKPPNHRVIAHNPNFASK